MRRAQHAAFPPLGKDKIRNISPWAVCGALAAITTLTHLAVFFFTWETQPHHPEEVDVLASLVHHDRRLGISTSQTKKALLGHASKVGFDDKARVHQALGHACSTHWDMVENIYAEGLHKAAETHKTPNDGTRNVWDLFESLWSCSTVRRIGKVTYDLQLPAASF